ncbi:uncharacterized protein LOC135831301 [Planococcus citri]|uniref:uncharacterized protein LOC135831301 n=1 Tax=Planococcus citri TaxID=170843 RepID=UPI0031F776E2
MRQSSTSRIMVAIYQTLSSNEYNDVSVKVGEEIYPFNRLRLALASNYFEKLFTLDYTEKNSEFVEIRALDSNTFSVIIDIINGKDLESLINTDNYVSLLIAMDYLQMEIDLKPFESFIGRRTYENLPFDAQMLELCYFIPSNRDYDSLKCKVHVYLSHYFMDFLTCQEFLNLPLKDLTDIMMTKRIIVRSVYEYSSAYEKDVISRICAKWICHDVENRLNEINFMKLVNAANYMLFRSLFRKTIANLSIRLNSIEEAGTKEEDIRRCFYQLLGHSGEIDFSTETDGPEESKISCTEADCHIVNRIDKDEKWVKFFEEGYLYDVTIKAGAKTYKLHRSVLKTASEYFSDLFSAERCETRSSIREDKDELYVIDIDVPTFDAVVRFIYFGDIVLDSPVNCIKMLKAGVLLKIQELISESSTWIRHNAVQFRSEDILQVLESIEHGIDYPPRYHETYQFLIMYFYCKADENLTRSIVYRLWRIADIIEYVALSDKCIAWILKDFQNSNFDVDDITQILNKKRGEITLYRFISGYYTYAKKKSPVVDVFLILYTSEKLKYEKLTHRCMQWMTYNKAEMTVENVIEILSFTRGKKEFDYGHVFFLCELLVATWPDVNESVFCEISCIMLEKMLSSPNLFFSDPHHILDFCAKWIVLDVKNRYCLISKIAHDINRICMMNPDEHKITEIPENLDTCLQQLIRDKLWEVLSSTSLVLRSHSRDSVTGERPVFISYDYSKNAHGVFVFRCDILDMEFNVISSLTPFQFFFDHFQESGPSSCSDIFDYSISATLLEDNLFMLGLFDEKYEFLVYNLLSKKLYSLERIPDMIECRGRSTILHCNNQVYCCFGENDTLLRYSIELNRWEVILLAKIEANPNRICSKKDFRCTSDGKNLYRIDLSMSNSYYGLCVVEIWNFAQNCWMRLSESSSLANVTNVTNVKNGIAVFCSLSFLPVLLFNLQSQSWRKIFLPVIPSSFTPSGGPFITHTHLANDVLLLSEKKIYQLQDPEEHWTLKKDLSFKSDIIGNVVLIHRSV